MAVLVGCPNGHRFKTQEQFIGKQVVCPQCKVLFRMAALGRAIDQPPATSSPAAQTVAFDDAPVAGVSAADLILPTAPKPAASSGAPAAPPPGVAPTGPPAAQVPPAGPPMPAAPAPSTDRDYRLAGPPPGAPAVHPGAMAMPPAPAAGGFTLAGPAAGAPPPGAGGFTPAGPPTAPGRLGMTPMDMSASRRWRSSDYSVGTAMEQGWESLKRKYGMVVGAIGTAALLTIVLSASFIYIVMYVSVLAEAEWYWQVAGATFVVVLLFAIIDIIMLGPLYVGLKLFRREDVGFSDMLIGLPKLPILMGINFYRLLRICGCFLPLILILSLIAYGTRQEWWGYPSTNTIRLLWGILIVSSLAATYFFIMYIFASLAAVDRGESAADAMATSAAIVQPNFTSILFLLIAAIIIMLLTASMILPLFLLGVPLAVTSVSAGYGILIEGRRRRG